MTNTRDHFAADDRIAVSINDAMRMSGLGRTSLYAAIGDGSLQTVKLGRRRLVLVASLREWLAAHQAV